MNKPKILVVDDEPDVVQIIRINLELKGYEVVTAHNGVQALEQARTENPDLVLLDIIMPRLDGLSALVALKEDADTEHIPVVMLTARDRIEDMDEAARKGCYCYLVKPIVPMELLMIVRRVLETVEEQQVTS